MVWYRDRSYFLATLSIPEVTMPELPEIRWITQNLQKEITGEEIGEVLLYHPNTVEMEGRSTNMINKQLEEAIKGYKIREVSNRGKIIILDLHYPVSMIPEQLICRRALLIHFSFTGWLIPSWAKEVSPRRFLHPMDPKKHTRMTLRTYKGDIYLTDPRCLARVRLFDSKEDALRSKHLKDMGPDADTIQGRAALLSHMKKSGRRIRDLIMDQKVIAGVGNYLCVNSRSRILLEEKEIKGETLPQFELEYKRFCEGRSNQGVSISVLYRQAEKFGIESLPKAVCFDSREGKRVLKPIKRVFKRRLVRSEELLKLKTRAGTLYLTEDHLVRSPSGCYKAVRDLTERDRISTYLPLLTDYQMEVMVGTILGDSEVKRQGDILSVRIMHGEAQIPYLEFKRRVFSNLVNGENFGEFSQRKAKDGRIVRVFYKDLSPVLGLEDVPGFVLKGGRLFITKEYLKVLTPRSWAIWFYDDGHLQVREGRRSRANISMTKRSLGEVEVVRSVLGELGFETSKVRDERVRDKDRGWRVDFNVESTEKFLKWIAPYFPSRILLYKNPYAKEEEIPQVIQPGVDGREKPEVRKDLPNSVRSERSVYDLEIEEAHNYYANGIGVHNCCEILYRAGLHGAEPAKSLTIAQAEHLGVCINQIIHLAETEDNKDWWEVFQKKETSDGYPVVREEWNRRGHFVCYNKQPPPVGWIERISKVGSR